MHPNIPSSTIYNNEDKEDVVYAYNGILPGH